MKIYVKDPSAVLDYTVDWSRWVAENDVIVDSAFTVSPSGLTIDSDALDGARATVWLSGGTADASYTVTCHVESDDGREDDRSFIIRVQER